MVAPPNTTSDLEAGTDDRFAIGFDPGRDKCGIARVRLPFQASAPETSTRADAIRIDQMRVVDSPSAIDDVLQQCQAFPITTLVMGDGTSSKYWSDQLKTALPDTVQLVSIDEYNSTQEARDRYWRLHPPRGLLRLMPAKLRSIPHPIDDLVAVILVERWLATQLDPA